VLAAAAAASSVGCLLPRNFDARLVVRKDRTYTFSYRGILTIMPIKATRAEGLPRDPDEEEMIAEAKKSFAAHPEQFRKAVYLGDGDFDLDYEVEATLDKDPFIGEREMPVITLTSQPGGRLVVAAFALTEDVLEMAEAAGIKSVNGRLTLETDGRIVKHNARTPPAREGTLSKCSWRLDSLKDPTPEAVIDLGRSP
jgi:hypothetical protein